jgi:hypothetical protein
MGYPNTGLVCGPTDNNREARSSLTDEASRLVAHDRKATPSAMSKIPPTAAPGRARLSTTQSLTGSSPTPKTIGIVVVAALAAIVAKLHAGVIMTPTRPSDNERDWSLRAHVSMSYVDKSDIFW